MRAAIKRALPESTVADFRQSHPIITAGLDRATVFLSLVSLIALIVGAIGVGMAMHAHLQQKMDHIAVMKSLGATSGEIIRIYTLQTLMLGLAGGVGGVLVGRGVEQIFPALINQLFAINAPASWHVEAAAQGIAAGILTTLLFTVPPLLAIRKIRPALILRRDMPEAKLPWAQRVQRSQAGAGRGGHDSGRHRSAGGVAGGFAAGGRLLRGGAEREPAAAGGGGHGAAQRHPRARSRHSGQVSDLPADGGFRR